MKWDKDLELAQATELINGKLILWYQRNKSAVKLINQRDFLEKKLKFTHQGKIFIFFTSIPDTFRPAEGKITRAYSIMGFHIFERLEDGRLKFTGLAQTDINIGTGTMARMATATAMT